MKIKESKLLSFTYVYFFESGLFNGLQSIQIKFSPASRLAREIPRARRLLKPISFPF
jgi:hypothetical protein